MQAIILAAGVGRRLASLGSESPKCLLRFDGRSLLHRHLDSLESCGVDRAVIVVGHLREMIEDELASYGGGVSVETTLNERYRQGSILSLRTGLVKADRADSVVVMDADVLYHTEVLRRLVNAPFDNGFLLDERSSAEGEEMMLGVKDGRVHRITRQIGSGWDLVGEGVGFFKVHGSHLDRLTEAIDGLLDQGKLDADYESAIDAFLAEQPAYYVPVADLPWTEIDFDEDVERARNVVLPAIENGLWKPSARLAM